MRNYSIKKTYNYTSCYGYDLYMDVYYPERSRGDKASVLTLASGKLFGGDKDDDLQTRTIEAMLDKGFIVINADYRQEMHVKLQNKRNILDISLWEIAMSFQHCIESAVEDCVAAISFICEHAEDLGIDIARITIAGASAGAITVLQTEFNRVNDVAMKRVLPLFWKPLAVVAFAGAVFCNPRQFGFSEATAPFFLVHGGKDKVVLSDRQTIVPKKSFYGSRRIERELIRANSYFREICFSNGEHEVSMLMPEMMDVISSFIDCAICGHIENEIDQYVKLESNLTEIEIEKWRGKTSLKLIDELLRNNK